LAWDNEQRALIEEYRKKKKELDEKFDRERPQVLPDGSERYRVEPWTPPIGGQRGALSASEPKEVVRLSAIDLLEREMEEEYQQVLAKDRARGKDFNKAAYEHMKLSRYHFQYLRM
jgi:hypothetical protein